MPCPNYTLCPLLCNSCILWGGGGGGGVTRISDKSGIKPAATRGFTGEKDVDVDVDGDVTVEAMVVDKDPVT